ncbi:MAG: glycosyltransferase family 2 protein [Solirubrobacterales bacterium]
MRVSPQREDSPHAVAADGPGLEVVIVSSTGALELLRSCLRSLREQPYTGGPMLVHVVDNASTDSTPEMVHEEFPEVRLHALDWNSGFCIANNIALRQVASPYVLVLNPDTEIYPGSLDHMVALMEQDPSIGMASCRLEKRDGSLDHAAKSNFPTPLGALSHWLGLAHRFGGRLAQYHAPELDEHALGEVELVSGAYMLTRKAAIDEVGLLDEGYWMYMDDLDWCYRFKLAGWKIVYDGRVSSLHVKGGTTRKKRHRGLRHNVSFHRSIGRFYRKFNAGRNPLLDVCVYLAIGVKLVVSATRSAIARRSIV